MLHLLIASLAVFMASPPEVAEISPPKEIIAERISGLLEERPDLKGISVTVRQGGRTMAISKGQAAPDGTQLTAETPIRIASVAKTFTAATVLRLYEQDMVDLDTPIRELIDERYDILLSEDGYDTSIITVRHLLMHVSGMPDAADRAYIDLVLADTSRQWKRDDQLQLLVENHDPLGPPNTEFRYSDTGYVLLGHIIERLTGDALGIAVRRELKFDEIGLTSTWWEQTEMPPATALPRGHQYLGEQDTHDWNGSMDLYGGGGLISTTTDLSRFMQALFNGEIYDDPETLELMTTAPGHPFPDNYRIGLFPREISGVQAYSHGGFWGVEIMASPAMDYYAAGVSMEQSGYRAMVSILRDALGAMAE